MSELVQLMMNQESILCYILLFFSSLFVCGVIARYGHFTIDLLGRRDDLRAVQASHQAPVPRIGGLVFFFGLVGLVPLSGYLGIDHTYVVQLLLALVPILVIGLAEDLGWPMTPRTRLAAIAASGACMLLAFGYYVPRFGVPLLDPLLTYAPVAGALTIFMASGVVNAFNLVDGLNGFCGFIALSTALALTVVAHQAGLRDISLALTLLIPMMLGFLAFNYPFGKIFLGDAGAYMIGHTLVWIGIAILSLSQDVSPFAILLIFFWPVADTLLAIYRRGVMRARVDRPDRLHFHQLVMRYLEIRLLGRGRRRLANPIATLCLAPLVAAPQVLGALFAFDNQMAAVSTFASAVAFVLAYVVGMHSARVISRRRVCASRAVPSVSPEPAE